MKVLCVLYDDPVDGYPKAYARDEVPRLEHYRMVKLYRRRTPSTLSPASCSAAFRASSDCAGSWKKMDTP